jgi:hypothetical protein
MIHLQPVTNELKPQDLSNPQELGCRLPFISGVFFRIESEHNLARYF